MAAIDLYGRDRRKALGRRLEIERAFVFSIRLYPLLQPPSSGEAWFRNAFDSKAGYCEQAAAQNAIVGESRQRRFCHRGHVQTPARAIGTDDA
ncbi:hypothetical protein [Mesorhizobium sp.]|uniref:hypothetical protein n=1 Tax=Mesorhizobium sp. TaxID=1871066 RepID=UPI0025F6E2FD|nr:hypothetical protein [Mesorhizobium sp.]